MFAPYFICEAVMSGTEFSERSANQKFVKNPIIFHYYFNWQLCLFICLFIFTFHRSKLGYKNLKDIEIVVLL